MKLSRQILKNKDVKILLESILSLSLLRIISYVFPIITLPYIARVIGTEKFGILSFATSIVIYFETITDFGFNYTATKDVAKNREDINYVSKLFSVVIVSKLFLMFFSALLLFILTLMIPILDFYSKEIWYTFLYIPGYLFFPEWLFQALEKMKYITILNLLIKLVFTMSVFIFIKDAQDYIFQPLLIAVSYLLSGVLSLIILKRKFNIYFVLPKISEIIAQIKKSFNIFLSLFLPNLYSNFSVILLGAVWGQTATGVYSAGKRFVDIIEQFNQVLSRSFFPFLARKIDKYKYYECITFITSIFFSVLLYFLSDFIVYMFYGDLFAGSVLVLRILALSPFLLFLANTYGSVYLVLIGKDKVLRNIVIVTSVFGFCFSCYFTYKYSYIGAAITIIASRGILGICSFYYAKKAKIKDRLL